MQEGLLIRAGSWQPHGEAVLLKTTSDVLAQVGSLKMEVPKSRLAVEGHEGKTNSVDSSSTAAGREPNSAHHLLSDSATDQLLPPLRQISLDIIAATELNRSNGLAPERQSIFQDVFEQLAAKDDLPPLQSGQLYTLPSMQFLESMLSDFDSKQHGSSVAAQGMGLGMGMAMSLPLDLPSDAFDLPDFTHTTTATHHPHQVPPPPQQPAASSATAAAAALRPTPFDQQQALEAAAHQHAHPHAHQQQQQQAAAHQHPAYYGAPGPAGPPPQQAGAAGYSSFVPMGSAPPALQLGPSMHGSSSSSGSLHAAAVSSRAHSAYAPGQLAPIVGAGSHGPAAPALHAHPHYHSHTHASHHHKMMLIQQQQQQAAAAHAHAHAHAALQRERPVMAAAAAGPPVRQPAVPQPQQPRATPRRAAQAYADFDYEEAEVSLQTSKSGRVRKVALYTGVKRRLDVAAAHGAGNTVSESRDSRGSVGGAADVSSGEVGSKGSKGGTRKHVVAKGGRKSRRTVCLNCGCHQTPQWRCGPLGPRTLCNACGVRYKKDLPLACWPIRDGMVLPPGAVLPPGFVVPPGITIHTQPAEIE